MPDSELYREYDREEAISFFGEEASAQSLCDGQWVILPHTILCFANLGKWPSMSHFKNGARFCWVAEKPYQSGLFGAVPTEILSGKTGDRNILLFARKSDSRRFLFLGHLAPAHSHGHRGKHNFGSADLPLSPTLPSRIWADLGGFRVGDLNHAALDAALDRLRGTTTSIEHFEIFRSLVEYWHGPIRPKNGYTNDELQRIRMPEILKRWYSWAGQRTEIMSGQNSLKEPRELKVLDDGRLLFYVENQGCYLWAIEPHVDDPPVFGQECGGKTWQSLGYSLSQHLMLACIFEAVMRSPYGAWDAGLGERAMIKLAEVMRPLPIAQWGWCEMQFWAGNGVFGMIADNGSDQNGRRFGVYLGAKSEEPLTFLKSIEHQNWEYKAF